MKSLLLASFLLLSTQLLSVSPTKDKVSDVLVSNLNKYAYKGTTVLVKDCPDEKMTITRDQSLIFSYDTVKHLLQVDVKLNSKFETLNRQKGKSKVSESSEAYKAIIPMKYIMGLGMTTEFFDGCEWNGPTEALFSTDCDCIEIVDADGTVRKDKRLVLYIDIAGKEGLYQSINEDIGILRDLANNK